MQVTELKQDGLQHEYKVVVAADAINDQLSGRLDKIAKTAQMPGFRKGKVPLPLLRKRYNAELMEEILRDTVSTTSRQVIEERKLRPAVQPDIAISSFQEGSNLEYTLSIEVFPEVVLPDYSQLKLEKLVADIAESDINDGVQRLAGRYKNHKAPATPRAAAMGDIVIIDFDGSIDGVPFEGGKSENFRLELGSGQFINGFEDQLVGSKLGETRDVKVTFPAEYHHTPLAGKPALFKVMVKEILEGSLPEINEDFVKKFNMESVDALKEAIREQIQEDCASVSRTKLKKELFDRLEKLVTFQTPGKMVEMELNALLESAKQEQEGNAGQSEEEQKKEYREIAERRVKLGILLAETSKENALTVNQDELKKAVFAQARSYPGQEHMVMDFYRKNPQALEQLRGPILEDKAVDFIIAKAAVTEKKAAVKDVLHALDELE